MFKNKKSNKKSNIFKVNFMSKNYSIGLYTGESRMDKRDSLSLPNNLHIVSKLFEQGQTLYSYRHSGAIEIFKRTGSITKLQKAMGHSSINVSLTYLRGLEVAELTAEDMPMV